jgi:nicotinate-nucleotide adenylyltransferase
VEICRAPEGNPATLGVLASAFNPPTTAHLALARAALRHTNGVLFVLPRALPHKKFEGVGFEERLEMLLAATGGEPRFGVATSRGGLFIEIARECREAFGATVDVWFVCGRDAAERIVAWDYGEPGAIGPMLGEFGLLVADRAGRFAPPAEIAVRSRALEVGEDVTAVSSSEVRRRIAAGELWEELVPPSIRRLVAARYR